MDDALIGYSAFDYRFQSLSGAIIEDIGEDLASSLEDSDDRNFTASTTPTFASDTTCSEVTFVHFHDSFERRCAIALLGDTHAYRQQMTIDASAMHAHQGSDFDRLKIQAEKTIELPKLALRKSGTFAVAIRHW